MISYIIGAVLTIVGIFIFKNKGNMTVITNLLKKDDNDIAKEQANNTLLKQEVDNVSKQTNQSDSTISNDLNKL